MKHEDFEQYVKGLPVYYRLVFIHGERLFNRDECGYRIVYLQALYELASRPTGIIVTSEKLSKQQREELLAELVEIDITALGDGEPKSIIVPIDESYIRPVPPRLQSLVKYPESDDQDDALTDGQVWVAIGIMILIILIISFCAFPSP
ncbi:hypothetical protein BVG18_08420 [Acinetobacter lwoffii]|uniref:hypothetical protein n=1 Tax=Acinetobacter lwoffii TaxID=28090 RepID=UPI000A327A2C|nr:hypothetical protein BVG18_08420 [Acinetobacter lwoffii]